MSRGDIPPDRTGNSLPKGLTREAGGEDCCVSRYVFCVTQQGRWQGASTYDGNIKAERDVSTVEFADRDDSGRFPLGSGDDRERGSGG